jgi:hypothetical protein
LLVLRLHAIVPSFNNRLRHNREAISIGRSV